jgi:hypothetical protein
MDKQERESSTGKGKLVFTKMDKLQRWVARKDVKWAKQIGIFSSSSMYLVPKHPLV